MTAFHGKLFMSPLKSIGFSLYGFLRNLTEKRIRIVYDYPYQFDNYSFNQLLIEHETEDNYIDISELVLTCSTIVVYSINIGRMVLDEFSSISPGTWPRYSNHALQSIPGNSENIRVRPKECLHISIPNEMDAFLLNFDYCNSKEFVQAE